MRWINFLGLNKNIAYSTIEKIEATKQRMEIIRRGNLTILDDSYNASFHSFKSAFGFITKVHDKFSSLILVLGDIAELGDASKNTHNKLIKMLEKSQLKSSFILAKGTHFSQALKNSKLNSFHSDNDNELISKLKSLTKKKSLIYFKGSRDKRLELIIRKLIENK